MPPLVQTKSVYGSTTTLNITLSPVAVAGDIIVIVANSVNTVSTPAGFAVRNSFAGDQGFYVWEKTAAGGEGTIAVTQSGAGNMAVSAIEFNKAEVNSFDVKGTLAGVSASGFITVPGVIAADPDKDALLGIVAFHGFNTPPFVSSVSNGFVLVANNASVAVGAASIGHIIGGKDNVPNGPTGSVDVFYTYAVDNTAGIMIAYGKPSAVYVYDNTKSKSENEYLRLVAAGFGATPAISLRDMQMKEYAIPANASITDRRYADWLGTGTMIEKAQAGSKIWVDVDDQP